MNTAQLRFFTTIAQLENMSRASELLHISQSSLSKNLAKLEEEVGTPLFDRSGKKITLNAAGSRFLDYCNLTLRELEYVEDDLRLISTGSNNRIRIGLAGGTDLLMEAISEFHELHPDAEFEIDSRIESEEYMDINRYDVLVYPEESKYRKFNGFPLFEERCFLAVSEKHPLAGRSLARIDALEGENLIFLRDGKNFAENSFRVCMALSLKYAVHAFTDSRDIHIGMIAAGLGIGFVPEGSAAQYRENTAIRLIPLMDSRFNRPMRICFRREKHLSGIAKEFCSSLKIRFALETGT